MDLMIYFMETIFTLFFDINLNFGACYIILINYHHFQYLFLHQLFLRNNIYFRIY